MTYVLYLVVTKQSSKLSDKEMGSKQMTDWDSQNNGGITSIPLLKNNETLNKHICLFRFLFNSVVYDFYTIAKAFQLKTRIIIQVIQVSVITGGCIHVLTFIVVSSDNVQRWSEG